MRTLLAFIRPLAAIAKELRSLRELYELDLAQRDPPILRVTEQPNENDTEITYDKFDKPKPIWKRFVTSD